jgi:hypothetical protein
MECHIEATGIERRKFALNGDDKRWMGRGFGLPGVYDPGMLLPLATLLRMRCTMMIRM